MKIKSHFPDLKSATEAVRKLKSEGIKSVYVDATSPLSLTNAVGSSIKGDNGGKSNNIFVVIDDEGENFNKAKQIIEGMGGVFEELKNELK